jgi:diaminopimelate epimerase
LTDKKVEVNMKGGKLIIEIDESGDIIITGGVSKVFEGVINNDLFKNRGL